MISLKQLQARIETKKEIQDMHNICIYQLLQIRYYVLTFDPAQNAIQGDALEGSDTFQWQLGEEIAWAEIG